MASLRSMFLDPRTRFLFPATEDNEHVEIVCRHVGEYLREHNTALVNAQRVHDDIQQMPKEEAGRIYDSRFTSIPCPKPPLHAMWIETINNHFRTGILTLRHELNDPYLRQKAREELAHSAHPQNHEAIALLQQFDQNPPASSVQAFCFLDTDRTIVYIGCFIWWLNREGNLTGAYPIPAPVDPFRPSADGDTVLMKVLRAGFLALLAMARLNCHNVELRPVAGAGHKHKNQRAPSSVWHEIVVKQGPEIRAVREARTENPAEAEKHAVRLHNVRGHFADYRQGAGLFGKYKVLVWVEEHKSGLAEQGTVVASYRIS